MVDCIIGTPLFIQINVSGGEPDDVQVNVKVDPIRRDADADVAVITGAAICQLINCIHSYQTL